MAEADFGKGIISNHPELENIKNINDKENRKEKISNYVEKFYSENIIELEKLLIEYNNDWEKIGKDFFIETDKIFSESEWPEGKYICYLSIFNCNPHFLHNKTFQLFYKKNENAKSTICHEMLHFIFYHYAEKFEIPENLKWDISEIFNTTILNQPEFKKLIAPAVGLGYPKHKAIIPDSIKIWEKCGNFDEWMDKMIEKLTTSKMSKELFDEFKKLNFPQKEYAIVSSGVLAIRGIREAKDIDIIVSEKLWNELKNKYEARIEDGIEKIIPSKNVEVLWEGSIFCDQKIGPSANEQISHMEIIDGLSFQSFRDCLWFKIKLGREKDKKDLKLVKKYFIDHPDEKEKIDFEF